MASKFGNIKDLWSNMDGCIRDKTSFIELAGAASGGYVGMLALLAKKFLECGSDPNTQYREAVQLAELFGQTPPKQTSFGLNEDGTTGKQKIAFNTVTNEDGSTSLQVAVVDTGAQQGTTGAQGTTGGDMKTKDGRGQFKERSQEDKALDFKSIFDKKAYFIAAMVLGAKCTPLVDKYGQSGSDQAGSCLTWSSQFTEPNPLPGSSYSATKSRYPLTDKQFQRVFNLVKDAAALGTNANDMLARGEAAASAELAALSITPKPGTELGGGGGEGDTGTPPAAVVKKSNTVAMAGWGIVGGLVALGTAWYIAKAVKLK